LKGKKEIKEERRNEIDREERMYGDREMKGDNPNQCSY